MSATLSMSATLAIFFVTFLCQIILISIYYPTKIRRRILHVIDTYPPSEYPKLYPKPLDAYAQIKSVHRMRFYRNLNYVIAALGLMILSAMLASGYRPDPKGGDEIFVLIYFFVQVCPFMYLVMGEWKQGKLLRASFVANKRKADLNPRRLFDFIPPIYLVTAILLYIAWLIFYVAPRGEFSSWQTEVYVTIILITGLNIAYGVLIARYLHGKKTNPYQSSKDRMTEVKFIVRSMVFTSIAASIFLMATQAVDQYALEIIDPPLMSLYLQLVSFFGIGSFLQDVKVESLDFDVYKE